MEKTLTLYELDYFADYLGCYVEIDGDKMLGQLFCNVTGDWMGSIKLN